jgi:site-specific recombinase XerD
MLSLYRRHTRKCKYRAKGRDHVKCTCPLWCDGILDGKDYRRSLKTHDWQRAVRKLAALESPDGPVFKPVDEAVDAFLAHCHDLSPGTRRKYKNIMEHVRAFCKTESIDILSELDVERLDAYRAGRALSGTTSLKELQTLRQFFAFSLQRRWVKENAAKTIAPPRNIKPAEVVPYSQQEITAIRRACSDIGRGPYERLRAKAMVLLLRYTALRISDVATLERSRVRDGRLLVRTLKTGGTVYLPIPHELESTLDCLPVPRGVTGLPTHFFWNPLSMTKRCVVGIAERTLAAVFKKSAVPNAHAHRFRHTLATEILTSGGTEQDVADILGISPAIVRKHYAKWTPARQERITTLLKAVHGETVFGGYNLGTQ